LRRVRSDGTRSCISYCVMALCNGSRMASN
jgi:hypothetical protein